MTKLRTITIVLACCFATRGVARAAEPQSSPALEFDLATSLWLDDEAGDDAESEQIMRDLAAELSRSTEAARLAKPLKEAFLGSVKTSSPKRQAFFAPDTPEINHRERLGRLLTTLQELKQPIDGDDAARLFQSLANGAPDAATNWDLHALRSASFAAWLRDVVEANGALQAAALQLLHDPPVRADAARFFTAARLAAIVAPESVAAIQTEIDNAQLNKIRDESHIAAVYHQVVREEWNDAEVAELKTVVVGRLADELFRMPIESQGGADAVLLTADQYLAVAERRTPWTAWTDKGVTEIKAKLGAALTGRARALLGRFVDKPGDHFPTLQRAVLEPQRDVRGVNLFAYLHGYDLEDAAAAPWTRLNRTDENRRASLTMLREFCSPEQQAIWTVPLLLTLERIYVPRDPALIDELVRPMIVDPRVQTHPVRVELLKHIHEGRFPADAWKRWELAWDAAGDRNLRQELVPDKFPTTAIEFLVDVCVTLPLASPDGKQQPYDKLLNHVYDRLFGPTRTDDSACDDEKVIAALTKLFKHLATLPNRQGSAVVQSFFDRLHEAFLAETQQSSDRLSSMLVLMLHVSAVLAEEEPLRNLAESVGRRIFEVTSQTEFRVLTADRLAAQSAALRRLTPPLIVAAGAVQKAVPGGSADGLLAAFQSAVFLPLLRTNEMLARASDGELNPWLLLAQSFATPDARLRAHRALFDELTDPELPLVNSQSAATDLMIPCVATLNLHPWFMRRDRTGRPEIPLSPNVNLPLFKALLDASHGDLATRDADCRAVLRLFVDNLPPDATVASAERERWVVGRGYRADGSVISGTDVLFDVPALADYLANLTTLYEAVTFPFYTQQRLFDPFAADSKFEYSAAHGPAFDLPIGERWSRRNVDGDLRLALCRNLYLLGLQWKPQPNAEWFVEVNDPLVMLPNRRLGPAVPARLAEYEYWKREVVKKYNEVLSKTKNVNESWQFKVCRLILQLEMSLQAPGPNDAKDDESSAVAIPEPRGGFQDKKYERALIFEKLLIEIHNRELSSQRLLQNLLDELSADHGIVVKGIDDFDRKLSVDAKALDAPALLDLIGPKEITVFLTLLEALTGPDVDREVAGQTMLAYALVLPYYGTTVQQLTAGESTDRLLLFSLLSGEMKDRLATLLVADSAAGDEQKRQLYRELLLAHNSKSMLLAEAIFENRDSLLAAWRGKEYDIDRLALDYLFRHRSRQTLTAKSLFESAVKNSEVTFRLRAEDDAAQASITAALKWLFGADDDKVDLRFEPLSKVLKSAVGIVHNAKYEHDSDPDVRAAATQFRGDVKNFIDASSESNWSFDRWTFAAAADYLWLAEEAGEECESTVKNWPAAAQDDYERLWKRLLLGPGESPPWQAAFVQRFGRPGDLADDAPPAEVLRAQEFQLHEFVEGRSASDSNRRFHGLRVVELKLPRAEPMPEVAATYWQSYWTATRSAVWAAQVGLGLDDSTSDHPTPFLAEPFCVRGTALPQPIRTAELRESLTRTDDDRLYTALELPNRWDDRYSGRLGELIGITAASTDEAGLCGGRAAPTVVPRGLRDAAWQSLSEYARIELSSRLAAVNAVAEGVDAGKSLREKTANLLSGEQDVLRSVKELIEYRRLFNAAVQCFKDRSLADVATVEAIQRREAAWGDLQISRKTFEHCRAATGPRDAGVVAALWAPFQAYAAVDECEEADWLGLTPAAWDAPAGDDRSAASFAALLLLVEAGQGEDTQLLPEARARYDAVVRTASDFELNIADCRCAPGPPKPLAAAPFAVPDDDVRCVREIAAWTDLPYWLSAAEDRDSAVGPYGGRDYVPVILEERKLAPLSAAAVERVRRIGPPTAEWDAWYVRKLEFIDACDAACEPLWTSADGSSPALDHVRRVACRATPFATPFVGKFVNGRFECLTRRPGVATPNALRAEAGSAVTRHRLEPQFLMQVRWTSTGKCVPLPGGFMGYFDLLHPAASP